MSVAAWCGLAMAVGLSVIAGAAVVACFMKSALIGFASLGVAVFMGGYLVAICDEGENE